MMSSLKISAFGLIIQYGPQIEVICAKHDITLTQRIYAKGTQPHALQKLRNGFTASFSVYFFSETASKKTTCSTAYLPGFAGQEGQEALGQVPFQRMDIFFSRLLTQFKTCAKKSQQFQYSVSNITIVNLCCEFPIDIKHYFLLVLPFLTVNKIYPHVQKCL